MTGQQAFETQFKPACSMEIRIIGALKMCEDRLNRCSKKLSDCYATVDSICREMEAVTEKEKMHIRGILLLNCNGAFSLFEKEDFHNIKLFRIRRKAS